MASAVTRYEADHARIYCIPVRAFPMLVANVYIVIAGDYAALIDTSSGLGEAGAELRAGMVALREEWGETLDWPDLKRIIITHGHIDHYGGLGDVLTLTNAPVAIHELDRRVITNHEERLIMTNRAVGSFLRRAGVAESVQTGLIGMYSWSKGLVRSVDVATVLHDGDLLDDLFVVHHTPGHCPGQVCLQLGDVLLTADHVLAHTTPHLAPESLTPATGLDHYLQSLREIADLAGIRLGLAGHEDPIYDVYGRIRQIIASHERKLARVAQSCAEPHTINELTHRLYPRVQGYDVLLALEEIGAHVEYLDLHGELAIANIDEVASDERVAPQYRKL